MTAPGRVTVDQTYSKARPTGDTEKLVRRTNALLRDHIPLGLLLDLTDPAGPDSAGRFGSEKADLSWLRQAG